MEIKVKPKALESEIIATKVVEDDMKEMKECVLIGQAADEDIAKEQANMSHNSDEAKQDQDQTKSDSRSSSSSLEMIKKLENGRDSRQNVENTKKEEEKKKENNNMKHKKASSHVWDCGSSLYDSFELNSFKRQLDSAISASSARTMSMSHLPDRRILLLNSLSPEYPLPPPPVTSCSSSGNKKYSNKISRSLQRFLKSVFRPKHHQTLSSSTPSSPVYKRAGHGGGGGDKDRYYVVYAVPS